MEYGLIGAKLGHSYSKAIHEALCGYRYELYSLPTEQQAREFLQKKAFRAINVTIPYKQLVIPYCAWLEPRSKAIGAVNTVVNRDGILHGYNTDYDGFLYLANQHGVDFRGKSVLILGTGGTSRTVHAVAKDQGAAEILFASRTGRDGALTYEQAQAQSQVQILINTSPAGMYPNTGECHIRPAGLPRLEAVLDVVYNPFKTELILRAEEAGIPCASGLEMLVAQALYAARQFTGRRIPSSKIQPIVRSIRAQRLNVCLVGMPSCGKSTIGRQLARALNRPFVDLDAEIEKAAGKSIPQIFEKRGENGFRALETETAARFGMGSGQIISCGGGVVKRPENVRALRQNGVIVFIDRPVELLKVGGNRPLSTSMDGLKQMEAERRPLYEAAADLCVKNSGEPFSRATKAAQEALYEAFGIERAQS